MKCLERRRHYYEFRIELISLIRHSTIPDCQLCQLKEAKVVLKAVFLNKINTISLSSCDSLHFGHQKFYDPAIFLSKNVWSPSIFGTHPFQRKCQPPKWYPWCLGTFKIKPRIAHPVYNYLFHCYVLSIDKFWTYNVLLAWASNIDADSRVFKVFNFCRPSISFPLDLVAPAMSNSGML